MSDGDAYIDFSNFARDKLQIGRSARCHETEIIKAFRRAFPRYRTTDQITDKEIVTMARQWCPLLQRSNYGYLSGEMRGGRVSYWKCALQMRNAPPSSLVRPDTDSCWSIQFGLSMLANPMPSSRNRTRTLTCDYLKLSNMCAIFSQESPSQTIRSQSREDGKCPAESSSAGSGDDCRYSCTMSRCSIHLSPLFLETF